MTNRRPLLSNTLVRIALGLVLPGAILLIWHFASVRSSTIVPSIPDVFGVLLHPFREPTNIDARPFAFNVLISLLRVLVGFSLALLTAIPLGLLVGTSKLADRLFSPLIEMLRPICPIAWIPVAILVFGFSSVATVGWGDKAWRHDYLDQLRFAILFIIWWGAFFPVFVNTVSGVRGVRRLHIDAGLTLGARGFTLFRKVILPASLPSIITGMRVGLGISWMVIVAAEFFPGTASGLGYLITTAHQSSQYEYAFAAIIIIGVLGLGMNKAMTAVSDRLCAWESKER